MEQQRLSARTAVRAARGATRSDSRKRSRRSESPECSGKVKDNQLSKKLKNTSTAGKLKEQTKITSFSSLAQGDTPDTSDNTQQTETESTKMANNNNDSSDPKFDLLMAEFGKMNTKIEQQLVSEFGKMNTKIDQHIMKIDERMDRMDGKILEIENKLDSTQTDIKNLSEKDEINAEKIAESQHAANLAMMYAEKNEQYQRNFNLRIFNLPESSNETIEECETKVLTLFSEKLGVNVSIESIDVLHRLGPKPKPQPPPQADPNNIPSHQTNLQDPNSPQTSTNASENQTGSIETSQSRESHSEATGELMDTETTENTRPIISRPIIVSFVSRRVRREILANRFKLKKQANQKVAPTIIVEDLTKQRHALFAKARENKDKFKKVWSSEGRIFGRQQNGIDIPIDSFQDIISPPLPSKPPRRTFNPFTARFRGRGGGYNRGRGRGANFYTHSWRWGLPPRDDTPDDPIENLD